jgi:uncharacterized membrane protein YozB (DUF420 family)
LILAYIYFFISLNMTVASFIMLQHKHKNLVRICGLLLGYMAAIIGLKVYYMLSG